MTRIALFILTLFAIFIPASSLATCQRSQLPASIQKWIDDEQTRNDRIALRSSDLLETFRSKYSPEFRNIFILDSYWVPESSLELFNAGNSGVLSILKRTVNRKTYFRFFVHPDMEEHPERHLEFVQWLSTLEKAIPLCATSTSSFRTVLAWSEDGSHDPFLVKLSVDRVIGGHNRTVDRREIKVSTGMSQILDQSSARLPRNFHYFRESIGYLPRGGPTLEHGLVIREFPVSVSRHEIKETTPMIPLFALHAAPKHGTLGSISGPYLLAMLHKTEECPTKFLNDRLIRPFSNLVVELFLNHALTLEPHAQNIFLGLDQRNTLSGEFFFRDLAGILIDDLDVRRALGLPVSKNYPQVEGFDFDGQIKSPLYYSLTLFARELAILEQSTESWRREGRILDLDHCDGPDLHLSKLFLNALYDALDKYRIEQSPLVQATQNLQTDEERSITDFCDRIHQLREKSSYPSRLFRFLMAAKKYWLD